MSTLSARSLKNLEGVHPNLVKVMKEAVKNSPVDFTIVCGVRTTAEQQALYAQGRTKAGRKVTNADGVKNKSNHQAKADGFGHAVDLYPYYNGSVQVNDKDVLKNLEKIANHILCVANEMGIHVEWGGRWKFVDPPHFQLK